MDLAQLEVFVAVAEYGGITAASEKLLRAPSNVSTRIKQLETELGVALLIRNQRRVTLSPEGETFLEYARKIMALSEEARTFAQVGVPRGQLRIGALESTAAVRIPALLASFHLAYPLVDLELEARSSGVLLRHLLDGDISAAFTDGPPQTAALQGVPVFQEELLVLTPQPIHSIEADLVGTRPTAFVFGKTCSYRQKFEDWMHGSGVLPGRLVEITSYYAMLACVAAGAGICMMPRSLYESLPGNAEVRAHHINPAYGRVETYLTWRNETHSTTLKAFLADSLAQLSPEGFVTELAGALSDNSHAKYRS